MYTSNTPEKANIPPPKRRNRSSKLDRIYYPVAHLLLDNARLKLAEEKPLSLEKIAENIARKHGISVHKSTLSRYITKHGALKLI